MIRIFPLMTGLGIAGVGLLGLLLVILGFVFWLWVLIDCLQRRFRDKVVWVLVLILLGPLGALLYLFLVKNK